MDVAPVDERPLPPLVGDAHADDRPAVGRDVELHMGRHDRREEHLDQVNPVVLALAQATKQPVHVLAPAADDEGGLAGRTLRATHDGAAGGTQVALHRGAHGVVVAAAAASGFG